MKELNMPRACCYVTLRCNLRCKLCGVYAPYYENPYHPTIEYLCRCLDRYFEVVNHTGILVLSGGEPLLRKELHMLIDHIHLYRDRMDRLDIFTNGTIVPGADLLESLAPFGDKLRVVVSNYGPSISINAEKVVAMFSFLNGAEATLRDYYSEDMHCNGWVDYSISRHPRKKSDEEARCTFAKCASPKKWNFIVNILNGILYPCGSLRRAIEQGLVQAGPNEVVDLFDESHTDDEIRDKIAAVYSLDVLSACAYCNGLCDDSPRYVPAEQLTPEELKNSNLLWSSL